MHELAITQSMFDLILDKGQQVEAKRVGKINLVIGEMTGVVPDSVRFYFEIISKGSIAEQAALSINIVPAQATCQQCHHTFVLPQFDWTCPECQGNILNISGGNELFLESIEVE